MKGVNNLKRKLDVIRREESAVLSEIQALLDRISHYHQREFEVFLMSHCKRIVGFPRYPQVEFDNGLKARMFRDSCSFYVCDGTGREIGKFCPREEGGFIPNVPSSQVFRSDRPKEHADRIALLVEMVPELWSLVDRVLPAWLEASKNVDMESLMTTRVLRWIAKQVGGTQWPDIVAQHVVDKIQNEKD